MYQYQVSFGEAIARALRNYCKFSGRASRSEFWWFFLFVQIVGFVLDMPWVGPYFAAVAKGLQPSFNFFAVMSYVWGLAMILPLYGLLFRRLHDTGRSGWWWLLGFIPVIGQIVLLVWLCMPSQPGDNQYGPEPNIRY